MHVKQDLDSRVQLLRKVIIYLIDEIFLVPVNEKYQPIKIFAKKIYHFQHFMTMKLHQLPKSSNIQSFTKKGLFMFH